MKKILCYALLTIVLLFSFTGCLQDDYDALVEEIEVINNDLEQVEDEIDEVEDAMTLLQEEITQISDSVAAATEENENLFSESEYLFNEKEELEEKIERASSTGLGFTIFEFEAAIQELIDTYDYFSDVSIDYVPYDYVEDNERLYIYYLYYEEGWDYNFIYELKLCEDLVHVNEVVYTCHNYIGDNFGDEAGMYLYAFAFATIMSTMDYSADFDYLYDIFINVESEETFIDGNAKLLIETYNDIYYFTIIDPNK